MTPLALPASLVTDNLFALFRTMAARLGGGFVDTGATLRRFRQG